MFYLLVKKVSSVGIIYIEHFKFYSLEYVYFFLRINNKDLVSVNPIS